MTAVAGPHNGAVTHHQDQSISPVSLSTKNTAKKARATGIKSGQRRWLMLTFRFWPQEPVSKHAEAWGPGSNVPTAADTIAGRRLSPRNTICVLSATRDGYEMTL